MLVLAWNEKTEETHVGVINDNFLGCDANTVVALIIQSEGRHAVACLNDQEVALGVKDDSSWASQAIGNKLRLVTAGHRGCG